MNTESYPFNAQIGKIHATDRSRIEYRIEPNVAWVVTNFGKFSASWCSHVARKDNEDWNIRISPLNDRDIIHFKKEMLEQKVVSQEVMEYLSETTSSEKQKDSGDLVAKPVAIDLLSVQPTPTAKL